MIASGPLNAKIWIIGDAPTKDELKAGEPFVSYAGKFLKDKIRLYGASPSDCRFEYIYPDKPPKGKFGSVYDDAEAKSLLFSNVDGLKRRIRDGNPNLVLCLGAQPLKFLMGETRVDKWRGHLIWSDELGCKTMVTHHPSVALRQRRVPKKNHPGQYETLFMYDIKKALEHSRTDGLGYKDYETITHPSYSEARGFLEKAIAEADILSYDIETDCYSVMDCIGLAYNGECGICIPFHKLTSNGLVPYWKDTAQAAEIMGLLKQLLESEIPKVAQNSQYDTVFLHKFYNIEVKNLIWDTMVCAHALYSDLPKDLGTLISLYTNIPYHKYMNNTGSIEDHWVYCAADAVANLHIMWGEEVEADELGVREHYLTIPHSAIMPCVWMQVEGVKVDEELKDEASAMEEQLQEDIMLAMDKIFPEKINTNKKYPHKFNPGSSKDKLFLFDKVFGCKLHYNKGSVTFDKTALLDYMEDPRESVRLLARAIREFRLSQTMLSRLKAPLLEGRMHCSYYLGGLDNVDSERASTSDDEVGTDTGRLNSKKSIFKSYSPELGYVDCGANLQNLMAGVQRAMLIPDVGEGFLYLDLWAAEAFITALDAGEPEMLQMLIRGEKIHNWMLEQTSHKFPTEVAKHEYTYKRAKQSVHALNYGVQTGMMSKESGLPKHICEWQYNFYHNKFPGIKLRQERIKHQLINERKIKSLLGRQKVVIAPMSDKALKQAYAWPSQSVIGEITLLGMTKMHTLGRNLNYPWCFPALNTHDGLAVRYKLGEEKAVRQLAIDSFNIPLTKDGLTITVPIEIGWAKNFNDVRDEEVIKYDH